ncbi:hypothetical protein [Shinella zoogloeoides]|uniref:hypothetical protein n=1 Tax=Shinella zoogloeoides TaxID=352475 RepID=UPI0028A828AE|nr:hypothetical protein [Shinella zoogloeoides]
MPGKNFFKCYLPVVLADPVKEQNLNHPESSIRLRFVRALFQTFAKASGKPPYFASPLAIGRPDGHL